MKEPAPNVKALLWDGEAFLAKFWAMDQALVQAGFPAISPWWRREIERFIRSGCRRWTIRAGRRAGKSSTLCRLAVAWAWFGPWTISPGDVPIIPFVSVDRAEASARLKTISALLTTLGIPFEATKEEITTKLRPVCFRVVTCSTTSVVGFTSIAIFCDEVARWESRESSDNPAKQVIGSLTPTMATQKFAFIVPCSSAWSEDDYHAKLFDEGDTNFQIVSSATTWEANPTITEEETHGFEPDPAVWSREYGNQPGKTISKALDPDDVAGMFGRTCLSSPAGAFVAIDPSSLRGDAFAWMAGYRTASGEIVVQEIGGWSGEELKTVSMTEIVASLAARAKAYKVREIFSDQREEAALRAMFAAHKIDLKSFAWSESSKDDAMQLFRRCIRERHLYCVEHEQLRKELNGLKAQLSPSGRMKYLTNGLDFVSCLVTLFHAEIGTADNLAAKARRRTQYDAIKRKLAGGQIFTNANRRIGFQGGGDGTKLPQCWPYV